MIAVETAIIVPALLLVVALLIVLANHSLAAMIVSSAAAQGARAASLERDPTTAATSARAVASASLTEGSVECRSTTISVDASGLRAALGTPANVSVTVSCTVDFGIGLPGFPDSTTLTATKASPVDTYRSRR